MVNTKHTFETIIVFPVKLDMEALAQKPRERGELTKHQVFRTAKIAIIKDPKFAVIDDEAVGNELQGEDDEFKISLWVSDTEAHTHEIIPTFSIKVSTKDIVFDKPISLKEFMGDNYSRNSRIRDNEISWLKYFNS